MLVIRPKIPIPYRRHRLQRNTASPVTRAASSTIIRKTLLNRRNYCGVFGYRLRRKPAPQLLEWIVRRCHPG